MEAARIAFIHVPKTGGTSISTILHGRRMGHRRASETPGEFRFSFVRNPYDRIESVWRWRQEGGDLGISPLQREKEFDPDRMAEWIEDRFCAEDDWLRPMSYWLDAPMDFIGRFERYEADVRRALTPFLGEFHIPHLEQTSGRRVMDERARAVVRRHYAEDFKRFGYDA